MAVYLDYSIVYLNLVAQIGSAALADALHENARQLLYNRTVGTIELNRVCYD